MPDKNSYKFLPLGHKHKSPSSSHGKAMGDSAMEKKKNLYQGENFGGKDIEMGKLPGRSPSCIAKDVLTNSIYKHKKEEKARQKRKRWMIFAAVGAAVFLLVVLVIVISVVVTQKKGGGSTTAKGRWGDRFGLLTIPMKPHSTGGVLQIQYNRSDPQSYQNYISALEDIWMEYEGMTVVKPGLNNCSEETTASQLPHTDNTSLTTGSPLEAITCSPPRAKAFPLEKLGTKCTKDKGFGYKSGRPCVLLVLRVPSNWNTQKCSNNTQNNNRRNSDNIRVQCMQITSGNNTQDASYRLFPTYGFSGETLADRNLENYLEPLVMFRVGELNPEEEVTFQCSVCPGYKKGDVQGTYTTTITLRVDN